MFFCLFVFRFHLSLSWLNYSPTNLQMHFEWEIDWNNESSSESSVSHKMGMSTRQAYRPIKDSKEILSCIVWMRKALHVCRSTSSSCVLPKSSRQLEKLWLFYGYATVWIDLSLTADVLKIVTGRYCSFLCCCGV